MNTPLLVEYTQLVKRIDDAENKDQKFKELKERLRAAVAFANRADGDEMALALRAENEAISALILHVHS